MDDEARRIREETRKRFKTMTFGQKAEYALMYYKWVFALIVGLIVFAFLAKDWIRNARTVEILGIMAVSSVPNEESEKYPAEVKELLGSDDKYEEVSLLQNIYANPETGEFDYQSQMALLAILETKEADVMLMPQKTAEYINGETIDFMDLGTLLKDTVLSDEASFDGPFLVLPEGNEVSETLGIYYQPVYVGLLDYCRNDENALIWIRDLAGK